jgi:hypothetical protein
MSDTTATRAPVRWLIAALGIIALVVVGAAIFASGDPDGLNRVAEDHGFSGSARDNPFNVIAGYAFPGLGDPLATIVGGLIGVAIVFVVVWLVGKALARRSR